MQKSISNAFTFMFKEEGWKFKLGVLVGLLVPYMYVSVGFQAKDITENIVIFCTLLIIGLSTFLACSGYVAKLIQNLIFNKSTPSFLPEWEDNFLQYPKIATAKAFGTFLIGLVLVPSIILLAIPILIYAYINLAVENIFCTEFNFKAYFSWKKAIELIKENPAEYFKLFITFLAIAILNNLILVLIQHLTLDPSYVTLGVLVSSVTTAYSMLVIGYLVGLVSQQREARVEEQLLID